MSETKIRVRMLQSAASVFGFLKAGTVIELPAVTARSWLAAGLAEEDKMCDGAPETK